MSEESNARILAPAALIAGLLALVIAIVSSGVFNGGSSRPISVVRTKESASSQKGSAQTVAETTGKTTGEAVQTTDQVANTTGETTNAAVYTIKPGDLLSTISEKTGVPVAKLIELNPDVDPQALVAGQKLKLKS